MYVLADAMDFFAIDSFQELPSTFRSITTVYPEAKRVASFETELASPWRLFFRGNDNMLVTDSNRHLFELAPGWMSPLADYTTVRMLSDGSIERRGYVRYPVALRQLWFVENNGSTETATRQPILTMMLNF